MLLIIAALLAAASPAIGDDRQPKNSTFKMSTHVYKTVGDVAIHADVYRHSDDTEARPVIVWIHGGALIYGNRSGVPIQLKQLAEKKRFALVSLDYRLAPEVKIEGILSDLDDAIAWIHRRGPKLFRADPSRMVVAGASAGGYLALMAGTREKHRPRGVVSYWGFCQLTGDWTLKPNAAFLKGKPIDKQVAWAGVGKGVLTNTDQQNGRPRSTFFLYLKQTGGWVSAVCGLDPMKDRGKLDRLGSYHLATKDFPPTMFLHGTADTDVPVGQSEMMSRKLNDLGVANKLITVKNGRHSLWGGDKKKIEQAFESSIQFIEDRLTAP